MLMMIIEKTRKTKTSKAEKIIFENKNDENDESSNCRDDDVIDEKMNDRMLSKNIERCR